MSVSSEESGEADFSFPVFVQRMQIHLFVLEYLLQPFHQDVVVAADQRILIFFA